MGSRAKPVRSLNSAASLCNFTLQEQLSAQAAAAAVTDRLKSHPSRVSVPSQSYAYQQNGWESKTPEQNSHSSQLLQLHEVVAATVRGEHRPTLCTSVMHLHTTLHYMHCLHPHCGCANAKGKNIKLRSTALLMGEQELVW